jgi:hypothetical protein
LTFYWTTTEGKRGIAGQARLKFEPNPSLLEELNFTATMEPIKRTGERELVLRIGEIEITCFHATVSP